MENVLPSERKNVKTSVGLSDKSKVRIIMKYLSMTRDEFCNEFRVLKSTMEGILKGSSKLGCKSKGKIIELYPEISKIWLEYGVGDMNGGLRPNKKLVNALENVYNTDIDEILSSNILYHISKWTKIKSDDIRDILDYNRQIKYKESLQISKFLKVKYHDILSENLDQLNINKAVSKLIRESYLDDYEVIEERKIEDDKLNKMKIESLDSKYKSPIYLYLSNKIDKKFLDPVTFSREVNIRAHQVWYMFKGRKKLSRYVAEDICDKFNLEINDMVNSGIVETNDDDNSKFTGPIYNILRDKIKGMSITDISMKTGIGRKSIHFHLYGKTNSFTKSTAKKYSKFLGIDYKLLERFIVNNDRIISIPMSTILSRLSSPRLRYHLMSFPNITKDLLEILFNRFTIVDSNSAIVKVNGRNVKITKFVENGNLILNNGKENILSIPEAYIDPSLTPRNLIIRIAKENLESLGLNEYIDEFK